MPQDLFNLIRVISEGIFLINLYGIFFLVIPFTLFGKYTFKENLVSFWNYTFFAPFHIWNFLYDKYFQYPKPRKVFSALIVFTINFLFISFFVLEKYKIPKNTIYILGILLFSALCIYLSMVENYKWKMEIKLTVLTFLCFVIFLIVSMFMLNSFLYTYLPMQNLLIERIIETFIVLYLLFTDISIICMCIDTKAYLKWLKSLTKPDTLKNHAPAMAKSIACSVLASSIAYIIWGSLATTSASGLVVGGISYVLFGKIGTPNV